MNMHSLKEYAKYYVCLFLLFPCCFFFSGSLKWNEVFFFTFVSHFDIIFLIRGLIGAEIYFSRRLSLKRESVLLTEKQAKKIFVHFYSYVLLFLQKKDWKNSFYNSSLLLHFGFVAEASSQKTLCFLLFFMLSLLMTP